MPAITKSFFGTSSDSISWTCCSSQGSTSSSETTKRERVVCCHGHRSGSERWPRSKIESLGVEALLNAAAVDRFMGSRRLVADLPKMLVEIFLTEGTDPSLNGRNNVDGRSGRHQANRGASRGVRDEVKELLQDPDAPFPFEYYAPRFATFAEDLQIAFKKHVRHLLLDSSRIDSRQATRVYTQSLFSVNADAKARSRLESSTVRRRTSFATRT